MNLPNALFTCAAPQAAISAALSRLKTCLAKHTPVSTAACNAPVQVGSGKDALVTLLHEGGHAAHLANVDQCSPFFSQERAPTSVAYAENQSMFLDAYEGDAAWLARYAKDRCAACPSTRLPCHVMGHPCVTASHP